MFLGRITNSPYSLVWSNAHGGSYALFARAIDTYGRSMLSAPVHITVSELRPSVQILSPTNGMSFAPQTNITLLADASETGGGTVQAVNFYANGHALGSVSNAPYSLVWSNVPAGFYFLMAVATDLASHHGYSSPVFISVGTRPRETQPFVSTAPR
jgi:chitinase